MLLFHVAGVLLLLIDEVKGQVPSNLPSNGRDVSLICDVMFPTSRCSTVSTFCGQNVNS